MRRRILFVCMLLLAGCAAKLVPDDYKGPTATIRDSHANYTEGGQITSDHAEFFVLAAADGAEVQNSFSQTFAAAEGVSAFRVHERKIPIKPMQVTLKGLAYYPSSTGSIKDPHRVYETQRTVSFSPAAGVTYTVRGKADQRRVTVWIEDANGQRVAQ